MNAQTIGFARACAPHCPEGFLRLEVLRQHWGFPPAIAWWVWRAPTAAHARTRAMPPSRPDPLRTDRARLQPWFPGSLATRQLRAWVSLIDHLTVSIVRQADRLRAVPFRYRPAALELCRDLTSQISLQFIQAYQHNAALLLNLVRAKAEAPHELQILFHQHPDSEIVPS